MCHIVAERSGKGSSIRVECVANKLAVIVR